MENKKWTDADLRTAFEDGCKFINFKDLQDFLLERRQNADTSERQLTIPDVSNCYMADCLIQDSCLRFKQQGCNKDCKLYM